METEKLTIGVTYKITATPKEGYIVDSIVVMEGTESKSLDLQDGESGAKWATYPVITTTKSITANFVPVTPEEINVEVNYDPEQGVVEIVESN